MSAASLLSSPRFLRNVLWADAASCLVCGALQVAWPGRLAPLLGLPAAVLLGTGAFLLVYGAFVGLLATREPVPRPVVWLLVAGNLGWALGCLALVAAGALPLTGLGQAYVLMQALTVAVLAELQWFGLRRAPAGWA